jgi:hypothetical protein
LATRALLSSGAFDLPCHWAPLQSVTAVTSRLSLGVPFGSTSMRGKVIELFEAFSAFLFPVHGPGAMFGAPFGHRGAFSERFAVGFDDSSHGVRSPSAFEPGRSLRWFASPTPSAHRVSHSLSGLIPPWPRGFVSRHIRPRGFVTTFRAFPVRSAVTSLDVRFPLVVPAGELSLSCRRLQGFDPTERPFSGVRG